MIKVYKGTKLSIYETLKANTPRPALTAKHIQEDIERRKRALRDARLARFF